MLPHGGVKHSGWVRPNYIHIDLATRVLTSYLGSLQRTMGSRGVLEDQDRHVRGVTELLVQPPKTNNTWKLVTSAILQFNISSKSCTYIPTFSFAIIIYKTRCLDTVSVIYDGGRTSKVSAILGSQSSLSFP
jgi:hypothetical protein